MENVNIPVNYVAIHQGDYRCLIKDNEAFNILKEAALSGIYWKRYSFNNSLELEYNDKPIMDALRILFPLEYRDTVEAAKEAFLADEAKGEEE